MKWISTWFKNGIYLPLLKLFTGSIRRKQVTAFLIVALIPLLALGFVIRHVATNTLMDQAREQLGGICQLKRHMVQEYFSECLKDLQQLAGTLSHLYAAGSDQIHAMEQQRKHPTDIELAEAIKAVVSPPVGEEKTDMIAYYRQQSGFENIYLIERSGYVFHVASPGPDLHTNLFTGEYKDTNLARLAAKVFDTKSFGMADFEKYPPAQNTSAAFMAQPVVFNGEVKFIVAVQLSIDQIAAVAQERSGLGRTGETYFIGQDKMLRNDAYRMQKLKKTATTLNPEYLVNTEASRSALQGDSGTKVLKNAQDILTLSSWQPITVTEPNPVNPDGIRWALISEIETGEITQPLTTLDFIMACALVGAVLLVIIGALVFSGSLTRRIRHIMDLFGHISRGDFHDMSE